MAKKVAAGSKASQKPNVAGKRLGIKVFGGQFVKPGQIIVRQRGTKYKTGVNVGLGKDHTIFSKVLGIVQFSKTYGKRTVIGVKASEKK